MNKNINVVEIMNSIKEDIKEQEISVADQYLATKYYVRRMNEYRQQEQLVIFGMGNYGTSLYYMLEKEGLIDKVKCFCDNNTKMQNSIYKGLQVLSPKEAVEKYPDAMFIITPMGYENEIIRQLSELDIDVQKISIFVYELTGLGK